MRVHVEFDLDADPVQGTILGAPVRSFVGWIELVSALGELRGEADAEAPTSPGQDGQEVGDA